MRLCSKEENNCAFRGGKSIDLRPDTQARDATDYDVAVCSYYTVFYARGAPTIWQMPRDAAADFSIANPKYPEILDSRDYP